MTTLQWSTNKKWQVADPCRFQRSRVTLKGETRRSKLFRIIWSRQLHTKGFDLKWPNLRWWYLWGGAYFQGSDTPQFKGGIPAPTNFVTVPYAYTIAIKFCLLAYVGEERVSRRSDTPLIRRAGTQRPHFGTLEKPFQINHFLISKSLLLFNHCICTFDFCYPRRARSAIGVDTVFTLDVCLYVCMLAL